MFQAVFNTTIKSIRKNSSFIFLEECHFSTVILTDILIAEFNTITKSILKKVHLLYDANTEHSSIMRIAKNSIIGI